MSVFTEVQRVRSFEGVVSQVRNAVLNGDVAIGERLTAERDLARDFGVSRTTLREALRALESEGLIEIQLGRSGGIFVAEPNGQFVGAALDSLLNLRRTSRWEIQEYRTEFEPMNARLAAKRCTEEDLDRLALCIRSFKAAVAAGSDGALLNRLDAEIHAAVASATHNEVRASIMMGLSQATMRMLESLPSVSDASPLRFAAEEFDMLYAAIRDVDPDLAAEIMTRHLMML